jgi:hypothetical protein
MILENPLISFESAVATRLPEYGDEILLPNILELFDLPQIFQSLAPLKVTLINPLLGDKSPATKSDIQRAYQSVTESYQAVGEFAQWSVQSGTESKDRTGLITEVLSASRLKR